MGARVITPIAVGLVFVVLILQTIGVATPHWVSIKGSGIYFGLWRYCVQHFGQKQECDNFPSDVSSWLEAVRALGIIALLFMAGTAVSGIISAVTPDDVSMSRMSSGVAIVGSACALVSTSIFAANYDEMTQGLYSLYDYDYSFFLCIAAGIAIIIPAVMFRLPQ